MAGSVVDVRDLPEPDRHVSAEFLRELYLGRLNVALDPRGPVLVGVRVDGNLSLLYGHVAVPIRAVECFIDGVVDLTNATTSTVQLEFCRLRSLMAGRLQCGGMLGLSSTELTADGGFPAVFLNGARIAGAVHLQDGFTCSEQVSAIGIQTGGQLNMRNAKLTSTTLSLNLEQAEIRGGVFLHDAFTSSGEIDLLGAHVIGQLDMRGATLTHTGDALQLAGAEISGSVNLRDGFECAGRISCVGARIGGQVTMVGATLTYPGPEPALAFDGAEVGGGFLAMARRSETSGAPGGAADTMWMRFTSQGPVQAEGAHFSGQFNLSGALLEYSSGDALLLEGTTIDNHTFLGGGLHARGRVAARGLKVRGELSLQDGVFSGIPESLDLGGAEVTGDLRLSGRFECRGIIRATNLSIHGAIIDDPNCWPDGSIVEGLEYRIPGTFGGLDWSPTARVAWLDRMTHSTQAYRYLADRYRARGMPDAADDVMVAMRRRERRSIAGRLSLVRRVADRLFEFGTGYGYRPIRTVGLAAAALVVTTLVLYLRPVENHFVAGGAEPGISWTAGGARRDDRVVRPIPDTVPTAPLGRGATDDRTTARFEPLLYAADTVIPLVDLGQRKTWVPDTNTYVGRFLSYFLDVMRIAGWLFAAAITFAVARIFQTRHG